MYECPKILILQSEIKNEIFYEVQLPRFQQSGGNTEK
mgnify:CR=1 FL=1